MLKAPVTKSNLASKPVPPGLVGETEAVMVVLPGKSVALEAVISMLGLLVPSPLRLPVTRSITK